MAFAYGEGIASYFGIVAQSTYQESKNIYSAYTYDLAYDYYFAEEFRGGECDEVTVTAVLLRLLGDISNIGESIKIGHEGLWKAMTNNNNTKTDTPKHQNISSLISTLITQYDYLKDKIGCILECENLSANTENNKEIKLCSNNNITEHKLSWEISENCVAGPNVFTLVFEGEEESFYRIEDIQENSFILNSDHQNKILDLKGNKINWYVISKYKMLYDNPLMEEYPETYSNEKNFESGGYISKPHVIYKPEVVETYENNTKIYKISEPGELKWFKFTAPVSASYKIKSKVANTLSLRCQPMDKLSSDNTRCISALDYNEDSNGNFEFNISLVRGETIYLRLSSKSNSGYGNFILNISENGHICSYKDHYSCMNSSRHIAYCRCGECIYEFHTFDSVKKNGLESYRVCRYCGEEVKTEKPTKHGFTVKD